MNKLLYFINNNNNNKNKNKNNEIIIINFKFRFLAAAPDEIFKILKKYETNEVSYYLIYNNIKELKKLITSNKNKKIIIHFHNNIVNLDIENIEEYNIKKIIQYHSEPIKTNLEVDNTYTKLVLNQYQCLLPEYKDYIIVRNYFTTNKPIVFNNIIKIGFYPSLLNSVNKYADKGFQETVPILNRLKSYFGNNIIVEVLFKLDYNECIKKKSDCHIIIDECKTGSFHKSTIEGLVLGSIVFVYISDNLQAFHNKIYKRTLPVVNVSLDNLEEKLKETILLGKNKIEEIALKNRKDFLSYWNDIEIFNEYNNIYKNLLEKN